MFSDRSTWRRLLAPMFVLTMMVAGLTVITQTVGIPAPASAAPGTPGVPSVPEVLYVEDFENRAPNSNIALEDYVSDTGMTYSADPFWLSQSACNGIVMNYSSPWVNGQCSGQSVYDNLTPIAYALGLLTGAPTTNAAVSAYTAGGTANNQREFMTTGQLTLPAANRFVTFSVDAAAESCSSSHPKLRFYLRDAAGTEHPVSSSAIDPCTDPGTTQVNVPNYSNRAVVQTVRYGRFAANSSMLLLGNSLGIVMRNENGSGAGNDGAFDNIRVLDVTPQLDKSFSPRSVPVGGVSRLTFTVTNTSELAAKPGWSGTDVLESGLVVADPASASTTCSNGSVTATAGGDTIGLAGDLLAGEVSCTFSVNVTSNVPVTGGLPNRFENCASNFPDLVGLNPPACADIEFYGTPELEITKSSDATSDARPGDTVTYSVTATNVGDDDYTAANPAVVVDDLTGVLDDGDYDGNATATQGTAPTFDDPRLTWSGALPKGESVTLDYTVTITGNGDGIVRNVAFGSDDPDTPTPSCDPPVDGTDPDTGLPCAEEEFELPRLEIDKAADRTELPAIGEQVTYSVTVTNPSDVPYTAALPATFEDDLSEVLDDATLDEGNISASTGAATFADPTLSWSGALAAGASATISYTVTYTGEGDNVLTNTVCVPAADVSSPELPCDSIEVPGSDLSQWKAATPSSDPLVAGSTVEYTLYFENDGEAAADINAVDDLTHVVDDADVTVAPTSPDGLTTALTGNRIAITGSVPAGETYTVTYTVTIKADGERGDDIAANFLLDPEDTPPTEPVCEPTIEEEPDCTINPIAAVDYSKAVEASTSPIEEGTELTYTVTVTNTGTTTADVSKVDDLTSVLDDADVTSVPVVTGATSVTASPVVNGIITIGGTIGAGETATITYVVTVKAQEDRGDNRADNFLVNPGETPPEECDPDADECTSTPLPNITPSKSVDPASGTSVSAGDELTYTLTFVNDGDSEGPVDYTDHLADVLDDAEITGGPTSSPASVTAALAGETIVVGGTLAAGGTATVTYTVTVGADGDRGDNELGNVLVPGDEEPPTECEEGSVLCTENPVGELADWKTVDASETPAGAGTELTYTLHFENRGEGDVTVDRVDDLTHVLDDADVSSEPVATGGLSATRTGTRIAIAGTLASGASATVIYVVTVKPDSQRSGDDIALNFLLDPGEQPPVPPSCDPENADEPDCTSTPIENDYPDVTCQSDPNIFNTGYNETTGGQMGNGTQDPRWTVAGGYSGAWGPGGTTPQSATPLPPADAVFVPALVGKANNVWADSPYGSAQWISASATTNGQNQATGSYGDWYYRYQFNLAPEVDPSTFSLTMNWLADNAVMAVWVNGESQTGDNLPQTSTDPYTYNGFALVNAAQTTLAGDWRTGQNTIMVLMKSYYVAEGFDAFVEPTALCPDPEFSVEKTASSANAQPGETVTYEVTVTNTGNTDFTTEAPASFTDDLSEVLDDAAYNGDASDGAIVAGSELSWSGPLAVGESVTITYSVTVGDPPGGDLILTNGVIPGEDGVCEPGECESETTVGELHDWKTVEASETPVGAGTELTYTLHFENRGEGAIDVDKVDDLSLVLDDADVTVEPSSDDLTVVRNGARIAVTGSLEPGASATVTYTVTLKADGARGDDIAANFLLDPEDTPPTEPVCEPADGEEPDCTITPIGQLTTAKSVEASSAPIVEGTTLTYTLSFINDSDTDVAVDKVDDLSGVLDDATVSSQPISSDAGVTASEVTDGVITITGVVAAGETVTVTYVVTVNAEDARGDNSADNFLLNPGDPVPEECVEGDPNCTVTPLPAITPTKSVDPASGTSVSAGDVLTYTLTFVNDSEADGALDYTDHLAGVLDDAAVSDGPTVSDPAVTASLDGDTLIVGGMIAAGETATVTYQVTVAADGERGDNLLGNFLVPGDEEPPTECEEGSALCTENPIGEIAEWKAVEASETPVGPGTELTYTLFFENRGEGVAEVSAIDFLTHVLDDADVTAEPSSDTLTATRDGDAITISGSLEPGEQATVVYTVTVKADADRGDDIAANFLLDNPDPENPPTPPTEPVCQPTDAQEPDCTVTPIGQITTAKSVEASSDPIVAGTELTYTLTFDNQSGADVAIDKVDDLSGVLDDATVSTQPVSSSGEVTASEVTDGIITITGVVAAGETVTVTYEVTVNVEDARGDDTADNFLLNPGEEPPAECVEGDPNCTSTPLPNVTPSKSVDPASGTSAQAGDVLTYTLSFVNDGGATGAVDYTDYLSDVLDDATVSSGPTSSDAGVTATLDGETIAVTGTIAAGATVTVTYQVTVGADGERGNNDLGNFLVPGDEEPPTECVEGSALCTENPIGELHDWKTVEASETPVAAGTELTYTLHFENRGEGSVDVNSIDFLTHVLDDADVTAEPSSDTLTVTRDGETISITGSLEPGQSATVVYTVTVKADGERGDDTASNFLVENDDPSTPPTPPTDPTCQPTDAEEPDCTTTPIGQLTTGKSVEASSDPIVPGTTLTYTLTFDNQSEAAVTVDHVDDLSSVLDDADVTTLPASSDDALTVSPIIDGSLSITGELASGQTVTVTYVVTVKDEADRGDNVATNFLVKDGETPPTECEDGDPNCTATPLPNVDAAKSVDPASGSSVAAGDVLTYTLTFTNDGNATGTVDYTDHLADILDDATITGEPASSDAAVSAVVDGETITVSGSLAAGATVTVTYQVTVGADGDRGNNDLGNFLVPGDEEPPTECVEGSALCTENPIGELHDWKTLEASETPVAAGTELTYTLHFENRGEGTVDVNGVDFLTHVLDDADVTSEPTSDTLTVTRDGETITITGSLEPGQSATVAYTVTVKADGERGDDTASNFLVKNDDPEVPPTPPTDPTCEPTDEQEPDCTTTPIGSYTAVKTVAPDETPIGVGSILTYTLTFTNASEADAEVDETDTLTGVLDDATLVDAPVSSADSLVVSEITDGAFTIVGTLAAGETVTVVYTVSVNPESSRGDNLAANTLLPTDGDDECTPERCTETPLPTITPDKSVDPADGSTVVAGDVLTYTLTFANDSETDGSIEYTDLLADLLDDATVTGQPTSSSADVTATLDGDSILIGGAIAAGETVTVTYQVTVLPDGERGDNIIGNVVIPEGEDPPGPEDECEEGDPLCTENPVGELHDWKSVEASETPVAAGTELTYTLHFENRGEGTVDVNSIDFLTHVLDDADVTAEPTSDTLTVTRDGETITITGSLGAGESATVVYTVTVKADADRGDDTASNFLVKNDDPSTPPTDPTCQPTDADEPDCTITPIGRLDTSKAVSASSDPIEAGTQLTYTLTFDNQSGAAVEVDKVDDLAGVLDDAGVTAEPESSDAALTATRDGSTISVTGTLAPGQTVTVVYVVTVKEESERGDNVADNFLLDTGEEPPTECAEDDPNCTVTPLPNVDSSKSVDPASGSTVLPGDELTYTLTLTNSGEAAGAVHRIDYLAGVLDDAALTDGPTVSDPSVTAVLDGTDLIIGGSLQPGQTVTVTYTVTVLPDAERGDDTLTNFLFDTDEEPPGPDTECEDGSDCTENDVPRIIDEKSADPASGTPIAAGQEVTYTLHFRNDGAAAGAVSKDDVLTGVLDDADLTVAPVASSDSLTVSELTDGRIHIAGSLEPGESATVTYTVTVRPFAEQGDHVLGNWLVLPGETPSGECAADDPDCTVHPIGEIAATKSVDPKSGTAVKQGAVLRYTLTFTNTGAGAATVDYTDHLGDVLDDATLTRGPSSDVESIEVDLSGDALTVGGSLAAGATATVTYSATVMAYDRQGNHLLDNFLGLSGGEPEEQCVSDNPLCTSNPTIAPPPLAITGGELGLGTLALVILLILGGTFAVEVARRRRLVLEGTRHGSGTPMS